MPQLRPATVTNLSKSDPLVILKHFGPNPTRQLRPNQKDRTMIASLNGATTRPYPLRKTCERGGENGFPMVELRGRN